MREHRTSTTWRRLRVALAVAVVGAAVGVAPTIGAPAPAGALADPGATGPLAVTNVLYNLGDTAFTPTGFPGPVELKGSVWYPTGLGAGPYPLVILLHGRHATCFQGGSAFLQWPCGAGQSEIASYKGYDYAAQKLASYGYIVDSIGANGINAVDNSVFDLGANARARLVQKTLDLWKGWNTAAGSTPFGTTFSGKVDLTKVGTMGHSRGGEGVVASYVFNQSQPNPYGIKAVLPLAPVDFNRQIPNNVNLNVVLPYCDGDVSDLQGIHFYDDSRYNVAGDTGAKHSVLVMGANHNFFNTVWTPGTGPAGAADDWSSFVGGGTSDAWCGTGAGNKRLTATQQQATYTAYQNAFFRVYLGGETALLPYLTGDVAPPPSSTSNLKVSYLAPSAGNQRKDINRYLTTGDKTVDLQGGKVSKTTAVTWTVCGGAAPATSPCIPSAGSAQQPHTTPSARSSAPGMNQLQFDSSASTGKIKYLFPLAQANFSGYAYISMRVAVNFAGGGTAPGATQDFSIKLFDTLKHSKTVAVSSFAAPPLFPPGTVGPLPHMVLTTIRIPVSAFTGVDLTKVKYMQLLFNQSTSASLNITDVAFTN